MEILFQLAYKIEPIFYKLVYMSIIATILGTIIIIIKKLLNNKLSPKWISRIWLVFLISLILPMQLRSNVSIYNVIPINFEKIEEIPISKNDYHDYLEKNIEVIETNSNLKNLSNIERNSKNFLINDNFVKIIPIIWIIILTSFLLAYLITYFVFERKIKKRELIDKDLENILNNCKEVLNIKKNIKLIRQDIVKMPSIFGIFNVRILISDKVLELSNKEIEYIFLHELSHYKRKDNILNILITILKCIYLFNPIIWILLNQVKKDLEIAADELAMEKQNNDIQKEYCKTLVKVSTISSDKFLIQTMCLSDSKKNLERRIDSMKLIDKFNKNKKRISIISIAVIFIIVIIFYTGNKNYMSLKDITKLYNKASKCDNIHYLKESITYYENSVEETIYEDYYFKNNIVLEKTSDKDGKLISIQYINYNDNEGIEIRNLDKCIDIYDISNVEEENRISKFGARYSEVNFDDIDEYKYLGIENINGRDSYKYNMNASDEYINQSSNIWIDKEKGIDLRIEISGNINNESGNGINGKFSTTENYTYEFNNVSDNDIKRPDLEQYKDYTINRIKYDGLFY